METLLQDLVYAIRILLKKPGFAAVAIITLALGIGANTAIFTVVNSVLLRPLPFAEPENIMALWPDRPGSSFQGVSLPKFIFWRDQSQSFEAMAATQSIGSGVNLSGGDEPEFVPGLRVTADFFRVLGVNPSLGRGFTKEEDAPSGERVAILSDSLWRRRFGADPAILGRIISVNGESHTVVGVMPAGFRFTSPGDVMTPMRTNPASRDEGHNYGVIGRLKPGLTREQSVEEMKIVFDKFKADSPNMLWRREEGIRVEPYLSALTAPVRPMLLILLGAVTFVLLIACANVASLQLTHAAARRKEIAVRLALGAGWRRIARQLLTEGIVLALAGGLAGLLLAVWGVDALATLIPSGLVPRSTEISFDWRVLAFTLATAVVTGVIFALAPALQSSHLDVNVTLKEGAGKGASAAGGGRLRKVIVVAEVSLALVLLVGATLLIRTFANLRQVEPGFDSRNVLTFQVAPTGERYDTTDEYSDYFRRALERIKGLPGVEAAAVTSNLPLGQWLNLTVEIEGRADSSQSTEYRMVSPEYFRVMRMSLRQGREFAETDTAGSEPVVIVNEAYVRRNFSDTDPLGHRVIVQRSSTAAARSCQIVGVVNDLKQFGLASPAPPTVFAPLAQVPDPVMRTARGFVAMKFAVRTTADPLSLAAAARQEMLNLDASLPVTSVRSLEQIVSGSVATERFNMTLLAVFAGLGLVLAAVGIYGVISYSVTHRTHEIGIRMALGAKPLDILKLIVGEGFLLTAAGVTVGLLGALALTRLIASFLFGVSAADPATFATAALLLTAVALLASYIPARRATRVDPMIALRYE